MSDFILLSIALFFAAVIGAGIVFFVISAIKRGRKGASVDKITLRMLTERVRAVGKLVGLEVHAKEIATATTGLNWLPPIVLSQAKVAMIFQFEKQYAVELGALSDADIQDLGNSKFRVTLPPIVGSLRLLDVEPYDIQQGRVLGLIDVINMNAERQSLLMKTAQTQAAELFEKNDERYESQAREAIERQLHSLAKLFDGSIEIRWREQAAKAQPRMIMDEAFQASASPVLAAV